MTSPITYPSHLFTALVTASRITVIPYAEDGLIVIERPSVDGPQYGFVTANKVHPRVRPDSAARRLIARDLGIDCQATDLRLVALLEPEPDHPRQAVYTASVRWRSERPALAGCGRHRLAVIVTREQATRAGLHPVRVADLLTGPDLAAAVAALPQLVPLDGPQGPPPADAEPRRSW